AQPPDSQQDGHELGPVGGHDGNPLAHGYSVFTQGGGQTVGQRVELRQAQLPVLEHERGRLGHVPSFPSGQADPTSAQLRRCYRLVRIVFSILKNASTGGAAWWNPKRSSRGGHRDHQGGSKGGRSDIE